MADKANWDGQSPVSPDALQSIAGENLGTMTEGLMPATEPDTLQQRMQRAQPTHKRKEPR